MAMVNVWDLAVGEKCRMGGETWTRQTNVKKRMPGIGAVWNARLARDSDGEVQLFLRGILVEMVGEPV